MPCKQRGASRADAGRRGFPVVSRDTSARACGATSGAPGQVPVTGGACMGMSKEVQMWSRFSRIYLVSGDATAYRRVSAMRELDRVGIAAMPEFKMIRGPFKSSHEAHYAALTDFAHDPKAGGTCLVLEDDIRFLLDLRRLGKIVSRAPVADLVSFDAFYHMPKDVIRKKEGKEYMAWIPGIYGASCYSLSKVGALVLSFSYKRHVSEPPDSPLFIGHQDLLTAVSSVHACVQLTYAGCDNARKYGKDVQHKFYGEEGLDYSLYAVPEGFGYGKVVGRDGKVVSL